MSIAVEETGVATVPPSKEPFALFFSQDEITRLEKYKDLKVVDIHDKSQLKTVHDARMELVRTRTAIEKTRKKMNEDAQKQISQNNELAKSIHAKIGPVEEALRVEEDRVETILEQERVAAANAVYRKRVSALKECGSELPEMVIRQMSDADFETTMIVARAQAAERDRLAKIAAEQKEAADRLAAEQAEKARVAEESRLKELAEAEAKRLAEQQEAERLQQAERDRLAAENVRLAEERATFEREQREAAEEAQRKLDAAKAEADAKLSAQQAEIDAQRAEMERKQQEAEAEAARLRDEESARLEEERAELARQRAEIEAERQKQEQFRLDAEAAAQRAAEEEANRIAAEQEAARIAALPAPIVEERKTPIADVIDSLSGGRTTVASQMVYGDAMPSQSAENQDRLAESTEPGGSNFGANLPMPGQQTDIHRLMIYVHDIETAAMECLPDVTDMAAVDLLAAMRGDLELCLEKMRDRLR